MKLPSLPASWLAALLGRPEPVAYPATWIPLEESGSRFPEYRRTYPGREPFIDDRHRIFAECKTDGTCIDVGIPGWLRPADALKLYELAYFAEGDILEFGCYHGLSTHILSMGLRDGGGRRSLVSNDISGPLIAAARKNLRERGLETGVQFFEEDAGECCRRLLAERRRFAAVFVDHAHTYDAVREVCSALPAIVSPGGMCLFHDYNDARNAEKNNGDYGVWQAVDSALPKEEFEFYGVFGCSGLFRRLAPARTPVSEITA